MVKLEVDRNIGNLNADNIDDFGYVAEIVGSGFSPEVGKVFLTLRSAEDITTTLFLNHTNENRLKKLKVADTEDIHDSEIELELVDTQYQGETVKGVRIKAIAGQEVV